MWRLTIERKYTKKYNDNSTLEMEVEFEYEAFNLSNLTEIIQKTKQNAVNGQYTYKIEYDEEGAKRNAI